MHIIHVGSNSAMVLLEEHIQYLWSDVVGIGGNFCSEAHHLISLVLYHSERFISIVSVQSSIVSTMSLEGIFQTSCRPEGL